MMRGGFDAVVAIGMGVLALGSTSAEAAPIRYDCDTAAGAYSQIDFSQPGPDYRITGLVFGVTFRSHPDWTPVATVTLMSSDDKDGVGIRIGWGATDSSIEAVLLTYVNGAQQKTVVGSLLVGEQTPFEISVSNGVTRVKLAGRTMEVAQTIGENGQISISCSTGQFKFADLDWDAPPDESWR